eukprot:TRINITY_DN122_c0_g1_i1.p1 TRINITY_DN122_c0_g1~~TRINITY_DN122_c0_g1_i1.p1  ORF type:complete len:266 (+),score=102.54 TRINITY_DN122_c0_g1_i1:82-798(+)
MAGTWEDEADDWEVAADDLLAKPVADIAVPKEGLWDDEDEDAEEEVYVKTGPAAPVVNPDKKKLPKKKLTKKEQKQAEEHAKRLELLALMEGDDEDERARRTELEKQSDYEHAADLFGAEDVPEAEQVVVEEVTVLNYKPRELAEFKKLAKMMAELHQKYHESRHYPVFVRELCKASTEKLISEDVKEVVRVLNTVATEKIKAEKSKKTKKKGPKTTKTSGYSDDMVFDKYDEFDAFM